MSSSNETRKPAGRPSLLTAEQQNALENQPAAPAAAFEPPAAEAPRRKHLWIAGGVSVLVIGIALAFMSFGESEPAADTLAVAPAPAPAPVVAPAAASAVASAPAAAGVVATEPLQAADNSPLADQSPYHGVPAIRSGVFERIEAGFEKLIVVPDEMYGAEVGRVVVLGHYHGKFRGADEEFKTQVAHIWTVRDGRIVKFQQSLDTLKVARDSGAV